jgi:hypothetical protein
VTRPSWSLPKPRGFVRIGVRRGPFQLETDDERECFVDAAKLGGIEPPRGATEALRVYDGRLLDEDAGLRSLESDGRSETRGSRTRRCRRDDDRAEMRELICLDDDGIACTPVFMAAGRARRRETEHFSPNHLSEAEAARARPSARGRSASPRGRSRRRREAPPPRGSRSGHDGVPPPREGRFAPPRNPKGLRRGQFRVRLAPRRRDARARSAPLLKRSTKRATPLPQSCGDTEPTRAAMKPRNRHGPYPTRPGGPPADRPKLIARCVTCL